MKILEKIKSKNNLPLILFIILFINYIPLIKANIVTKESFGVGTKEMAICFAIELIILFVFFIKKIKITKLTVTNFVLLILTTIALAVVQVNAYKSGNYDKLDVINITCIFCNILFLFILVLNVDIEEKYIYNFFRGMILMGLFACIVNVYIYHEEILKLFEKGAKVYKIKSFFCHRNQFAIFLYTAIISNMFLILRKNKSIFYKLTLLVFLANLVFTASRTGIFCCAIFAALFFITTDRFSIKTKIVIFIVGVDILLGATYYINNSHPEIIENVKKVLIRTDTIKSFTGRSDLWEIGTDLISENNCTKFFGIGRFKGVEIVEETKNLTQFHSFYIEALVTGGIMELVYFILIYLIVIIKVMFSNLEKKYKSIYISMFISYFIYCSFESLSRFSIGCADTLCMIVFITIPILHAYSIKEEGEEKIYRVSRKWISDGSNVVIDDKQNQVEE